MYLKKFAIILLVAASCAATAAGCTKKPTQISLPQAVSCRDALSGDPKRFSPYDVSRLLDAWVNDMAGCWEPIVKRCLDHHIDIPLVHLAQSVNRFNRHETEDYFHKAVFRYFSLMDQNKSLYGSEDRDLLVAYCRYVLANARSANDLNLKNAELVTRRLDPVLHTRIFQ